MHRTLTTPSAAYHRTDPASIDVETWLAQVPAVAAQVPEGEQLEFLVSLFSALEVNDFPFVQHLECALNAMAELQ